MKVRKKGKRREKTQASVIVSAWVKVLLSWKLNQSQAAEGKHTLGVILQSSQKMNTSKRGCRLLKMHCNSKADMQGLTI